MSYNDDKTHEHELNVITSSNVSSREILHVSLGNVACSVSSYWMFLQGCAATSSSSSIDNGYEDGASSINDSTYYNIDVTHSRSKLNSMKSNDPLYYVPRSLFVDEDRNKFLGSYESERESVSNTLNQDPTFYNGFSVVPVNAIGQRLAGVDISSAFDPSPGSIDFYNAPFVGDSRYIVRQPQMANHSKSWYENVSSDGRQVIWDDDDEEEEEDRMDDYYDDNDNYNKRKKVSQRSQNHTPNRSSGETFRKPIHGPQHQLATSNPSVPQSELDTNRINHWQDVVNLSPWHPDKSFFAVPSTFVPQTDVFGRNSSHDPTSESSSSRMGRNKSEISSCMTRPVTYHQAASMTTNSNNDSFFIEWKSQLMENKLRLLLESCDNCQGIVLVHDGLRMGSASMYAGMNASLLQEFKEECPSAGRWNISITAPNTTSLVSDVSTKDHSHPSSYERLEMVQTVVEQGLALHQAVEYADATLPLQIPLNNDIELSLNDNIAKAAIALETCTLPYRLNNGAKNTSYVPDRPLIGLNGSHYYGSYDASNSYFPFGSTSHLEFREFLKVLQSQSSNRLRRVWELDIYSPDSADSDRCCRNNVVWNSLIQGTSLEVDPRMRQPSRLSGRQTRELPGAWMLDKTMMRGGILTPYSPSCGDFRNSTKCSRDRSSHHHFGLSASIRPVFESSSIKNCLPSQLSLSQQYVSMLIQGMGIKYQPEQLAATFVPQTIGQLLRSLEPNRVPGLSSFQHFRDLDETVLAVLGNTTRRYNHLHDIAHAFRRTFMAGSTSRGLFNRQVAQGLLPDEDDCQEALEGCFEIRDAYEPPNLDDGNDLQCFDDI